MLDAVVDLAADPARAAAVLRLGPKQAGLAAANRDLRRAPVLPAVERYAGTVYEGLAVTTLGADARAWVGAHVAIASALLGLVRADDRIPAYRLSASAALPGLPDGASLTAHWRDAVAGVLARRRTFVLDARSADYAALGPAPADAARLHVETEDDAGRRRALNHFNKLHKGRLVRALAESGADPASRGDLLAWGAAAGVRLEPRGPADVVLVV